VEQLKDNSRGALVRALADLLVSKELTVAEKRKVSLLLDGEIKALAYKGEHDEIALAQKALRRAIASYRTAQGLRSAAAFMRRIKASTPLRRLFTGRTPKRAEVA
jgi:hypothetical protein